MWISENMFSEQFAMAAQLRFGIQTTACIIKINVPTDIKARIFNDAQVVNNVRGGICGVRFQKGNKVGISLSHNILRSNLTTESMYMSLRAMKWRSNLQFKMRLLCRSKRSSQPLYNYFMPRICIVPRVDGLGGVTSFRLKFEDG